MNRIALPKNDQIAYIGWCDICEANDGEFCRGYEVYHEEICGKCRIQNAHLGIK